MALTTHSPLRPRSRILPLALVCGLVGVGIGPLLHAARIHAASKRDERHEIVALEDQWRTAQISGDLVALDGLLADDFIGISMTGQANTKAQQMERIRTRTLALTRIDLSDRKIKLVGPVAIVTSLAEVEGTNEGVSMKGTYRYTRIYQHLPSGQWKTTSFEATRVPEGRRP